MNETTERSERRSQKDRRRGFDRRDPESDLPRVPGRHDRRRIHDRRHALRREGDRVVAASGAKSRHG